MTITSFKVFRTVKRYHVRLSINQVYLAFLLVLARGMLPRMVNIKLSEEELLA